MIEETSVRAVLDAMLKIYERSPLKDNVCTCGHLEEEHDGGGCWLCFCSVFRSYNKVREFTK